MSALLLFFYHSSMTASPTATNPATPSSSGPKVTARWRCLSTHHLSATLWKTECGASEHFEIGLAQQPSHRHNTVCSFFELFENRQLLDCLSSSFFFFSGLSLPPFHAVPSSLALFLLTPQPPLTPAALPVVFPGVNTGGVGSYIYDKEPSAVTQPWTYCSPLLSLHPLFSTQHRPSTAVLFVASSSVPPDLCRSDDQPSAPDPPPPPRPPFSPSLCSQRSPDQMIHWLQMLAIDVRNIYRYCVCSRRPPSARPHPAFPRSTHFLEGKRQTPFAMFTLSNTLKS